MCALKKSPERKCPKINYMRKGARRFAEDLAIRYADACCGPRSGHFESMEEYGRRRDECMAQFFQVVALAYGTTENEIRASLTRRRPELDAASMISFCIIYVWLANALAFLI